ncbi:hypothetical protein AJ80_07648 [Polytolypa hystricis UAMH7299]|uniref:Uncharacterized protein n=1 Tax=Polytolypa hystricis (strain UAMH7299) TaxID=1447883 RepID=A0A2B7XMB2_POLH7|nr:hypothetical protein AJ80_07648 [Polytolypa hystricis UAMH7299]
MADDTEDPLIQALPPATDYLTYLTLLEYQLTPARLPILHKVLQDEILTTNIGWDLVQLLLPLLPASQECLQDVARLGNPREVILRVSDALMKFEPAEDEEGDEDQESDNENTEANPELEETPGSEKLASEKAEETTLAAQNRAPLHILQFNCLLSMLSVLHSRIKTKYPSRFVATSLQAVLEAYTTFPTIDTTAALLEFFADISGRKRPALPPRNTSETLITRASTDTSAPDPEADTLLESSSTEENALIQRFMQFGLVELLKTYLLHCISEPVSGMQWAIRLQEKLDPQARMPASLSRTEEFSNVQYLKERDMTIGKIMALSRDFGIQTQELLDIVSNPSNDQAPPLDFEHMPKSAKEVPLERHGCLLLLAARSATSILFSSAQSVEVLSAFPDLAVIFANFLQPRESLYLAASEGPETLVDSLLSLAVISTNRHLASANDEDEFQRLVLSITACTQSPGFWSVSRINRVPSTIFHGNTDPLAKFNLIRNIFSDDDLQYVREPALSWLKEEVLSLTTTARLPQGARHLSTEGKIFSDPQRFAVLFPLIYRSIPSDWLSICNATTPELLTVWFTFTQTFVPFYLSALNFYYLLIKNPQLHAQLHLDALSPRFEIEFLAPLKKFVQSMSEDTEMTAKIEMEVGNEVQRMGQSAAELVLHTIRQVEDASPGLGEEDDSG